MNRVAKLFLLLIFLLGCSVGPGKKPLPTWKTYKDVQSIANTAKPWQRGALRFEITRIEFERNYTVIKTLSYRYRFHFKVLNTGSEELDLFNSMAQGSLVFHDGAKIDRLVWVAGKVKIAPGATSDGQYFTDNSVPPDSKLKRLAMGGDTVASW